MYLGVIEELGVYVLRTIQYYIQVYCREHSNAKLHAFLANFSQRELFVAGP
jgi:hypothetical protein